MTIDEVRPELSRMGDGQYAVERMPEARRREYIEGKV